MTTSAAHWNPSDDLDEMASATKGRQANTVVLFLAITQRAQDEANHHFYQQPEHARVSDTPGALDGALMDLLDEDQNQMSPHWDYHIVPSYEALRKVVVPSPRQDLFYDHLSRANLERVRKNRVPFMCFVRIPCQEPGDYAAQGHFKCVREFIRGVYRRAGVPDTVRDTSLPVNWHWPANHQIEFLTPSAPPLPPTTTRKRKRADNAENVVVRISNDEAPPPKRSRLAADREPEEAAVTPRRLTADSPPLVLPGTCPTTRVDPVTKRSLPVVLVASESRRVVEHVRASLCEAGSPVYLATPSSPRGTSLDFELLRGGPPPELRSPHKLLKLRTGRRHRPSSPPHERSSSRSIRLRTSSRVYRSKRR